MIVFIGTNLILVQKYLFFNGVPFSLLMLFQLRALCMSNICFSLYQSNTLMMYGGPKMTAALQYYHAINNATVVDLNSDGIAANELSRPRVVPFYAPTFIKVLFFH